MAPPSKRKRDDDDDNGDPEDEVPTSSKKSRIEEAKRRAKEWGLQEKQRLEAAKAKRLSVESGSTPTETPKPETKPKKIAAATTRTTRVASTKKAKSDEEGNVAAATSTTSATAIATTSTLKVTASKAMEPLLETPSTVTGTSSLMTARDAVSVAAPVPLPAPTSASTGSAATTPVISATPANTPVVPSLQQHYSNSSYATGPPVDANFMAQYMMSQQPPTASTGGPFHPISYPPPPSMGYAPPPAAMYASYNPYNAALIQQHIALQMAAEAQAFQSVPLARTTKPPATPIPAPTPAPSPAIKPTSTVLSSEQQIPPIKNTPAAAIKTENNHNIDNQVEDDDDDDDDEPMPLPPVTTLQMQISQQVLANASASLNNQPAPYTKPPPEAYTVTATTSPDDDEHSAQLEHDDQPIIVDIEDNIFPISSILVPKGNHPSFIPWFVVVITVALLISLFCAEEESSLKTPTQSNNLANESILLDAACFHDSQPQYQEIQDGDDIRRVLIQPCANVDTSEPCPWLGFCQNGSLVHCTHPNFQVDPTGAKCELTLATRQDTVALWMSVLEERTIADLCVAGGSHTELPLFDYQKLQLTYPSTLATHPLDNAVMQTAFAMHEEEGRLFIGLPDDHIVTLPFRCRLAHSLRNFLKAALEWFGKLCWNLITFSTKVAWSMMSAYPLISLIGLIAMVIVQQVHTFQKRRTHLVRDVAQMRDMAFDKLQDQRDTAHAILHLRDDIVATLTADQDILQGARKQRHYWITQVWPRVVPQLQQDNRIKKTQRVESGGKRRDYWQWVAAPKSASKKRVGIILDEQDKKTK